MKNYIDISMELLKNKHNIFKRSFFFLTFSTFVEVWKLWLIKKNYLHRTLVVVIVGGALMGFGFIREKEN